MEGYFTQYIDLLNHNFIELSAEKRLKNISIVAKRIVEKNDEYRQLEDEIRESARIHTCSVDEIRLNLTYPEELEWWKMAVMGLNTLLLYIEDIYEIEDEPYFGYMRGRYTQEELKQVDDYAHALGIEVIPAIQTLAHL